MESPDVVVIGAGLAGLRCATRLARDGLDVVVLEAENAVGGRQRTDEVDGFLLDRGFQVLNPAYPAVGRWVDVDALGLRRFPAGVRVRREHGVAELGHPLRHPSLILPTLRSGLARPADAIALARWAAPGLMRSKRVKHGPDRTLREGWDAAGVRGPLRHEVLEPFLAGVLGDDGGTDTSEAFALLLVRMFALGRPGVPSRGIAALPAQLVERAQSAGARIRTGARVARVSRRGATMRVGVEGADTVAGRAVVVAVGPADVDSLVDVPAAQTRGLQTWWFATDAEAPASSLLSVDGRRRGPVVNTVVMSRTAPSYAPRGRHLIEATCLLGAAAPSAAEVRAQLAEVWSADARGWELLRRDDLPHALPAQPAPLRLTSPVRVADGVFIAGDHRDTASIQGALVSGERVAEAVLADLGRSPATSGV